MIEQKHIDLLTELSTDKSPHSGRSLFEHLKGTHDLLEKWENPAYVCVGGLFHSVYGTQYYKIQSAGLADRKHIADVIGQQAEELAFLFCTTNRMGFFAQADKPSPVLIDRTTKKSVPVNTVTLSALIEIEIANRIEQIKPDKVSEGQIQFMRFMLAAGHDRLTPKAREEFTRFLKHFE